MSKYRVKVKFSFTGYFVIDAETGNNTNVIIADHCGLVMGGNIHTTMPEQVLDWYFPVQPEKEVLKVEKMM